MDIALAFQASGCDTSRMNVTKRQLMLRIADTYGYNQEFTADIIQRFIDEIIMEMKVGNRIEIRDFGVFEPYTRGACQRHNPKTLEKVQIPARRVVRFKPGRLLQDGTKSIAQPDAADNIPA